MTPHTRPKRLWTDAEHDLLRVWLDCNTPTQVMAERLGLSAQHLRKHLNEIGLKPPGWKSRYQPPAEPVAVPPRPPLPEGRMQNWWPLEAGNAITWGAITTGTCLEGAPYQP